MILWFFMIFFFVERLDVAFFLDGVLLSWNCSPTMDCNFSGPILENLEYWKAPQKSSLKSSLKALSISHQSSRKHLHNHLSFHVPLKFKNLQRIQKKPQFKIWCENWNVKSKIAKSKPLANEQKLRNPWNSITFKSRKLISNNALKCPKI